MTRILDLSEFQQGAFVETGTGHGARFLEAMRLDFRPILSVEIREDVFQAAYNNVALALSTLSPRGPLNLRHGDSREVLPQFCSVTKTAVVDFMSSIVTFWLDARPVRSHDAEAQADTHNCPLLDELSIIRDAFCGSLWAPVIFINGITEQVADVRVNGAPITLATVHDAVKAIDPDYVLEIVRFRSGTGETFEELEDVLAALPAWYVDARASV